MTLDYAFVQLGEFDLPFYAVISNGVFFPESGKVLELGIGDIGYSLKSKKWKFTALQHIRYDGNTMCEIAEKLDELNKNTAKQKIFGFL